MDQNADSLREELYRVLGHYTELSKMARQGVVDPIGQIGKIVQKRFPYLLLVIGELVPRLERDEITYEQALYTIIREAQLFPDQSVLLESRNEIQEIESESASFIYAVKWLDSEEFRRPGPEEVDRVKNKLGQLNSKYRQRYAPEDDETTTIIPFYLPKHESESDETNLKRTSELVKRAVLELHHIMVEHESSRTFLGFTKAKRVEIEQDLEDLSWFLFRCGFPVERIASGYYKVILTEFLNEKTLERLIEDHKQASNLTGLSWHLYVISLLDMASFFEHPNDYFPLDDQKELARHVKNLRARNRKGANCLKLLAKLNSLYEQMPQAGLASNFLKYRYYNAYQDYHGDHRSDDPRGRTAVDVYKPYIDRESIEKQASEDLEESGKCFSSKTREEMGGILKLIMESLNNPSQIRGQRLKILGDISSGAMGEVSIGIYKDQIVALKRVKEGLSDSLGDPATLLEYEAKLHKKVQHPDQHPYIVDYFDFVDQDGEKILINSYHPNDNLTQLVERNWKEKARPYMTGKGVVTLNTLEVVFTQLLDCLARFKQRGVVHRDLKTDNILYMVDENSALNMIKVIDFGVGLSLNDIDMQDMFKGKVVGTFSYMAPEQAKGRCVHKSDLYSAGAIFTVLMTGRLPLVFPKTKSREDLIKQIVRIEKEPRPRLTDLNPRLKSSLLLEHLASIVEKMLDLDTERRPDLDEIQEAFRDFFANLGEERNMLNIYYDRGN
jgi:hypothetical protein